MVGGLPLLALLVSLLQNLPNPTELESRPLPAASRLYDRHGTLVYTFYDDVYRVPLPLEALPATLIQAVLAIEDQGFYRHPGFSLSGIVRAVRNNYLGAEDLQGGSTITQQLVKTRLLTPEKTLRRKLRELVLALRVELAYSKREILEMYLNDVAFGGTAYGVEAAARRYFGKAAAELTLNESAFLAGLIKAPSTFRPRGGRPGAYARRQKQVLKRMLAEGYISQAAYAGALRETLAFRRPPARFAAPHFVMFVREQLLRDYGAERLFSGGLNIHSTLDLALQQSTQRKLSTVVKRLFRYRVGNGAALISNPRTGEILAMVGSADYFAAEAEGKVNVVTALRQPGSAIKALTYAMALERDRTPASLLDDEPVAFEVSDEGAYTPRNNDYIFRGRVRLREALASSFNIPAVNELARIGVKNYIAKARTVGIDTWDSQDERQLGLTLGSGEVRMLDLAQLYSTFPNLGYPVPPRAINRITDVEGTTLVENRCAETLRGCLGERVFSSGVAFLINDILSDNQARATTFGLESDLYVPGHEVAVKTGATDYLRDNWAIGYTSQRLVATWLGNNDGSSMRFVHSGELGASTLWNWIMTDLLADRPPHRFARPLDIVTRRVCVDRGETPCATCETIRREHFVAGTEPAEVCES